MTKAQAEARKLEAEAEKFEADAELAKAKAKREEAEARKARAETKHAEAYARQMQIATDRAEEEREAELVCDAYRRIYRFSDSVSANSVRACMATLEEWARLDEDEAEPLVYEVVFTSPGGSVLHGMALFDHLRSLSNRGIQVVTTCLGYSASMAGILLQAGDIRRIGSQSYFHIHEISTGAIGKVSELEDEVEFSKKITARVVEIFVSRSGGKLTAPKLRKMFERREAWFDSTEAMKYGLVDEIV